MRKNLLTICLIIASAGVSFSQAPGFAWVKTSNSLSDPKVNPVGGIITDTINHVVYATGSFEGGINFGSGEMQVAGGATSPYLAKYDLDGGLIWAKEFYSSDDNTATGVGVDNSGNVYVCGYSQNDTVRFGSEYILNSHSGSTDHTVGYLVKFDSNGNVQWLKGSAGGGGVICEAVAVDAAGNSYMTGHVFDDSGTFMGNTTIEGAFFAKISTSGTLTWFKQTAPAGPLISQGISIVLDHAGNFLVSGTYAANVNFGNVSLAYVGGGGTSREFVAKMDVATGNCAWAVTGTSTGPDYAYDVAVDLQNNVYVSGMLGGSEHYVEKLDPSSGASQWLHSYPNGFLSQLNTIITDKHGDIYATFNISDTTVFGNYTVNTTSQFANTSIIVAIVKYDAAGNVLYAKGSSDPVLLSWAIANSSAVDANGNLYLNGSVTNECKFDGIDVNNGNTHTEFALIKLGNVGGGSVGIKSESSVQNLAAFPNPASDQVSIRNLQNNSEIKLIDINGRVVLKQTSQTSDSRMDVSSVANGAYILEVISNGISAHQKLIVSH